MVPTKTKPPYSYLNLLMDCIREGSTQKGVRVHDLKLQAFRNRPTPKAGTWGMDDDGKPLTRQGYERKLAAFEKSLPGLILPKVNTPFTLSDSEENIVSLSDAVDQKREAILSFPSSFVSPFPVNNIARAYFYPTRGNKAVIILPNLRAEDRAFAKLAKLLNLFGYTCLEAVHPYHGKRHDPADTTMVAGERLFSSNMHETLMSFSQGISDVLGLFLFLIRNGYRRIGIIGTSIGSTMTIMSLAYAEDFRTYLAREDPGLVEGLPKTLCSAAIINLSGGLLSDFIMDPDNIEADFVRKGVVNDLGLVSSDIERYWPVADPMKFVEKITLPILSVKARQDPVLLFRYAKRQRDFFKNNRMGGRNFTEVYLPFPAGHYSATYFLPKMFLGIADVLFILRHV